jgi:UDP-GlcNAc:undecaprenyl-phosphate/decaprenyl-phosphate GlcNAc-1-phosphate transferase
LSAFPVFFVGFCEDLGYLASPRARLLAAAISGAIFISLSGQWLQRTDIVALDLLMQWGPIGIGFSLFLAVGVSHSFNLIDGLNGFAGFVALGTAISLAVLSHNIGLDAHRDALIVLISAIAGFLIFNFPFGKIFLGDAGAYLMGHILVWIAISILCETPDITPFAVLLIFFWPVADTLLAIARRIYFKVPISDPDRLHFHQVVLLGVEFIALGGNRRHIANPLATTLMLPLTFAPMVVGVLFASKDSAAIIALFCFVILFLLTYKICMRALPKL